MEKEFVMPHHITEERKLSLNLYASFCKEENYWRLKSRSVWLCEGDKNTRFFHRQCKGRKNRNNVTEIISTIGECLVDHEDTKREALSNF